MLLIRQTDKAVIKTCNSYISGKYVKKIMIFLFVRCFVTSMMSKKDNSNCDLHQLGIFYIHISHCNHTARTGARQMTKLNGIISKISIVIHFLILFRYKQH